LYTPGPEGEPRLRIENGLIDLSEVNARGFGGILIPDTFNQSTLFSLPE
jgi:hypothetical protein